MKLGQEFLARIVELMVEDAPNFLEWKLWLDQIGMYLLASWPISCHSDTNNLVEEIIDQGALPRILVGVVGCTGAGKSSLINALVDEGSIVPCNSFRASTSVAVEISWNALDDPKKAFRAEVEFISLQEWHDEVGFMLKEIKARPDGEQLSINNTTDASIAYSKVVAVYPNISAKRLADISMKDLLKTNNLSKILGKNISIEVSSAQKLKESINRYIVSSHSGADDGAIYWPLIRVVRIFMKADLLKTGLVLVDLPGLGDSNAGRASVAESYLKNLRHMWVVAPIVRAVDNKIARDLMGQKFRRQLSMDGRYHDDFITFIVTHTDDLQTEEIIDTLGLGKSVLKNEIEEKRQLKAKIKELEQELYEKKQGQKVLKKDTKISSSSELDERKRKCESRDSSGGFGVKEIKHQLKKHNKELSKVKLAIKVICIQQRNLEVQKHMRQEFQNGLSELQQGIADGGECLSPIPRRQGISHAGMYYTH